MDLHWNRIHKHTNKYKKQHKSGQVVTGLEALGAGGKNTNTKTKTSIRQTQIKAQIRASGWWVRGAWSRCPGCPGGRNTTTNTKTNTSARQTQMQTQIKAQIRASGWWVGGAWSRCPGCPGGSCPFVRAHRRLPAQQHHCPHYLFTRCPAPPFGLCCPTRTTWPEEHLEQLGDISPRIDWPPTCPPWGHHLPILQCTSGPKLPLLLSSSDAKLSSWRYLELSIWTLIKV